MFLLLSLVSTASAGDYNCDGYDDLVVGVPGEGAEDLGALQVFYGSGAGPNTEAQELVNDSIIGVVASDPYAQAGQGLGHGDFDGSGCDTLVVRSFTNGGGFHTLPWASWGLALEDAVWWSAADFPAGGVTPEFIGTPSANANGAGDFDGDGAQDLALGVEAEVTGLSAAGAVLVTYGEVGVGLDAATTEVWTQDTSGVLGSAEFGDYFGYAVASADFDGDGYDDLAVGAPEEAWGSTSGAGAVSVLFGTSGGLATRGNTLESQADHGGDLDEWDMFGAALAAGDFNGDGYGDLATGSPGENGYAGRVTVAYGGGAGWSATPQRFEQGANGILGTAESLDLFGFRLAVGDFNADGYDDLAVSAQGEDDNAGAVSVIYGRRGGLTSTRNQIFSQDTPGVYGGAEAGDEFGRSIAAGDYDGDGFDDLVISAPLESWEAERDGAVHVLFGSSTGITATGDRVWGQDGPGVSEIADNDDYFGFAVQ